MGAVEECSFMGMVENIRLWVRLKNAPFIGTVENTRSSEQLEKQVSEIIGKAWKV